MFIYLMKMSGIQSKVAMTAAQFYVYPSNVSIVDETLYIF